MFYVYRKISLRSFQLGDLFCSLLTIWSLFFLCTSFSVFSSTCPPCSACFPAGVPLPDGVQLDMLPPGIRPPLCIRSVSFGLLGVLSHHVPKSYFLCWDLSLPLSITLASAPIHIVPTLLGCYFLWKQWESLLQSSVLATACHDPYHRGVFHLPLIQLKGSLH